MMSRRRITRETSKRREIGVREGGEKEVGKDGKGKRGVEGAGVGGIKWVKQKSGENNAVAHKSKGITPFLHFQVWFKSSSFFRLV